MLKKFFCVVSLILCLGVLAGCNNKIKYNAVLYDNAVEWIDETFASNNPVYYGGGTDDSGNPLPNSKYFIVKDETEFNEIFKEGSLDVDFETQMIIVYAFSAIYRESAELKAISLEDKTLNINYKINIIDKVPTACQPFQRWFVIKMDNLDISSAMFSRVRGE